MNMMEKAERIQLALRTALQDEDARTGDLKGKGNTKTFTARVIELLKETQP